MNDREVELEVGVDVEGFWFLSVDGVIYAQSKFEKLVRNLAGKVEELNDGITFIVIG